MADNYDDIIRMPHHRSKTRIPMSATMRAAQFAPFAALKGFEEALDTRLNALRTRLSDAPDVDEILAALAAEIEDLSGLDIYDVFSDTATDNLRQQVENTLAAGTDAIDSIRTAFSSVRKDADESYMYEYHMGSADTISYVYRNRTFLRMC